MFFNFSTVEDISPTHVGMNRISASRTCMRLASAPRTWG